MSRVITNYLTHADSKYENRHLCSINDHFSKTKAFCFINQNLLDKLRYSFVFTKSRVFLWVVNFRGLTAVFARLSTLSRTFIAGYICLTKNTGFFTRGGIYPSLLCPTRGGNRAGRAGLGRAKTGLGQNWPGFFRPKF